MRIASEETSLVTSVNAEVITNQEIINHHYNSNGIDALLHNFALSLPPRRVAEYALREAVRDYSNALAPFIISNEGIDVEFVRIAFDRMFEGMNQAADNRLLALTRGRILTPATTEESRPQKTFRPLSEEYWHGMFINEYTDAKKTSPPDTSTHALGIAYVALCFDEYAVDRFQQTLGLTA